MNADMLIKAFKNRIQINPFILSGNLYPLVDNGDGEMIEDTAATPTLKRYTNPVRISTRDKWMLDRRLHTTPVTSQLLDWYMVSDNETVVDERLEFTYANMDFKVTQRKEQRKHGELIGYEYELKDLTEGETYA